jgi:hypothetical protein
VDRIEVEVVIGGKTKKRVKVTKISISKFADIDTYTDGHNKLSKLDLPVIRHRRQQREAREQHALHDNLYDFQTNMGGDFLVVMARIEKALNENDLPGFGRRHMLALQLARQV